ncbi:TetR/AcrR family transcriptional regulator [Paenibacillus sp. CGMCC 1.16610]|uniref:TetR/AcrR family transcriptional regulator n=2 Tax=Paenibacillus TaxID=44249 RepID=A0ABU6DDX6_9BACL|nr:MULTISPECIES: TetR/AcrR family transcriptional regulator [Paenibacillus]MBA2941450.1 TetR/AcrR family transcriptional regulator [Paenibacillus sp. CGMCC 1.16610]MCY9662193.1 TetR/AcrR family transcriptional regulator [Paenibacillus anseongense]MEB4795706.1 TetR/AcrR family transcriptional regulator [Paenibacillus chondroitinus]MVQ40268.1 TetR family transcriptional regulator [Paenibacillus anseongense]
MSPKVTQAYKEEKKAVILEGALHCFTEKGFQATTMDDIVRHLGISKGAIYSYFASKEEMYIQMADDKMNAMLENSTETFKSMPSAADQIRYMYNRFRSQSLAELRKWIAFHLEFMLYAARQPQLTQRWNEYADKALVFIKEIMDGGKLTGEFRSDLDSAAASRLFWSIRDGLALHYMLSGEEADYKRTIDDMESMMFRYIMG